MTGLQVIALSVVAFVAAAAGIVAATVGALRFASQAMNPRRPIGQRQTRAALAALCVGGMIASACGGFWGIGALMYFSMGPGAS
jgi:hypothetical protein